jgi:hypothetical protein
MVARMTARSLLTAWVSPVFVSNAVLIESETSIRHPTNVSVSWTSTSDPLATVGREDVGASISRYLAWIIKDKIEDRCTGALERPYSEGDKAIVVVSNYKIDMQQSGELIRQRTPA